MSSFSKQHNSTALFPVRQMDFVFSDDIPKYWFNNSPIVTMVFSALSAVFPEGELGFVRSVRRYQPKITDPILQAQVSAFIGQEAHHGKEHKALNELMARKGWPTLKISDMAKRGLGLQEKIFSPARMLANTCALEHFTAVFAEHLLANLNLFEGVDERLMPLWIWHAVEESEHKSVAFDVFEQQVGSYWIRCSEMLMTTGVFFFFVGIHTLRILVIDKQFLNIKAIWQAARYFLQRKGFILGILPKYLAYYKPSFHPTDTDSVQMRKQALKLLEGYVGDKAERQVQIVV